MLVAPHGFWGAGGGNDSYTKLLLHMNGANGSVAVPDDSGSAHVLTVNGNAQISTAKSKFGGASGYFDGSGDYLERANHADFQFGSGDFTIDFWIYPLATAAYNGVVTFWHPNANNGDWRLYLLSGSIVFDIYDEGNGGKNISAALSTNVWTHVAAVKDGSLMRLFINGTLQASVAPTSSWNLNSTSSVLRVAAVYVLGMDYFNGYLDEVRISKGIARWTSDFMPPNQEYY